MQRFMVLYVGPPTPPDAPHDGWPAWFARLGDQLVDRGSPLANGFALRDDGSTGSGAARVNGYSVIRAEDPDDAVRQLKDHPYLTLGRDHSIDVHLLP
jgi:hypothetical protein